MAGTVAGWYEAWTTGDGAARRAVLGRCCEDDVEMRDAFACVLGVDELNDHIGNALKHMPGMKLESAGAAQLVHGFVRSPWKTTGPDGRVAFAGANFVRLAPSGRIAAVVGFWDGPAAG